MTDEILTPEELRNEWKAGRDKGSGRAAQRRGDPTAQELRFERRVLEFYKAANQVAYWRHEAVRFRIGPDANYTPDFLVLMVNRRVCFWEVKGRKEQASLVRFRVAAGLNPWAYFMLWTEDRSGDWTGKEIKP